MHLLLVVLHVLCELISELRLAPQLEPARLPVDESENSSQGEPRRNESSRCDSYRAASRFSRQFPRPFAGQGATARPPLGGTGRLRWRPRF